MGLRLFGISAFFRRRTGFRVFVGSHGFPCFRHFTWLPVSHGFACFRVFSVFPLTHGNSCFSESHSIPFHTEFRVFWDTRNSVSHGFPCLRVFGVTRDSVSHGFPCLRVFALPRSSDCMFVVWSFGRPRTCSSVRSLRNLNPSGRHQPFSASLLSRRWHILRVLPVRLGLG
jgi:hypothetical protein